MRRNFCIFRTVYSRTPLLLLSSLSLSLSPFVRGRGGKPKPGPGVITASQSEWEETAGGKNGKPNALQGQRPASLRETHKDREGECGKRVNRTQKQNKVTDGDHLELNKHCYVNEIHAPWALPLCYSLNKVHFLQFQCGYLSWYVYVYNVLNQASILINSTIRD